MPCLILTLAQARSLQRQTWPGEWAFLLLVPVPDEPDSLLDPERTTAGLDLIAKGWSDEQIALQLNWKATGPALRQLHRMRKRMAK
jgi:DNA-binding NarL/FixJ family response regulator